ncbi:MAG TPA: nickel-dependent hydrogenase large subunit [Candidatus Omnitrophota bacterium]|nr:nickel-dependent hydrogenase large subunit [Candidatus Omnitrophota bacterium]
MATEKIVIDPVTRIEGHLKMTVELTDGKITDAYSSGTMWRGIELILRGRDPRDAQHIVQRICGVCPMAHGTAATLCLDDAFKVKVPDNGRIIRNLLLASNHLQSHILHFYHLAALDYVQGPDVPPFVPRYKGDYRLPPKVNAAYVEHYLQALEMRKKCHEMLAVFGGKMPPQVTILPGGVTVTPSVDKIASFLWRLREIRQFINDVYIPDVLGVAEMYSDYRKIGVGHGNLLAYGGFPQDADGKEKFYKAGRYARGRVVGFDPAKVTEDVGSSWYKDSNSGKHPYSGMTDADPEKKNGYSWLKAPRYEGEPYEVGPLARMWVNGDYRSGISVIDRHAARAIEAQKLSQAMEEWLLQLKPGQPAWAECKVPDSGEGMGLTEGARGALGHWIKIEKKKIANYQAVVPTTWNCGPRDDKGVRGPVEEAMIGTAIADTENPIEIVRIIRSFDPCIACAVHLIKPSGEMKKFRVV